MGPYTPRETAEIKHWIESGYSSNLSNKNRFVLTSPLKIMNDVVVLGKEDILFR